MAKITGEIEPFIKEHEPLQHGIQRLGAHVPPLVWADDLAIPLAAACPPLWPSHGTPFVPMV